jgi:phosphoribosylformylglycinamidine cyclo-ligase
VFIASTGLHTNGASLARRAATRGDGLEARLPDGRTFGDALLEPSAIYAPLIEAFYAAEVPLTYTSHVTGHGFRKIMRANRQLTYRVTDLPPVPEVFTFMIETLGLSIAAAYGTFNMGAGFAVFCPAGEGDRVVRVAGEHGHAAWVGGAVEKGPRRVILEPVNVVFNSEELQLR